MIISNTCHTILALVVTIALCVIAIVLESYLTDIPGGAAILPTTSSEFEKWELLKKSLEIRIDLHKLFITWSIAAVGALAILLKISSQSTPGLNPGDNFLFAAAFILCIGSVYFGQVSIDVLSQTLSTNINPFGYDRINIILKLQYLLLLFSILTIGFHAYTFFVIRKIKPQ